MELIGDARASAIWVARQLVNDVKNYKLAALVDYFGIEVTGVHRSIADCLTTKQLYEKLMEIRQSCE